ncbi:MAG: DegT/DnrJ/EryC1/StrS family aminotransferase, partial [Anaerovibrio sp.]|nr:DegT/DnrJ/EryC1/StrS family aminotransferase [Anaerovibrio sp.]
HLYLVSLLGHDAEYRNAFIEMMAEKGVATIVHYKPLPLHTAYKNMGFDIADYPNAYNQFANEITLPLHTRLTDEDVAFVIESFLKTQKEL